MLGMFIFIEPILAWKSLCFQPRHVAQTKMTHCDARPSLSLRPDFVLLLFAKIPLHVGALLKKLSLSYTLSQSFIPPGIYCRRYSGLVVEVKVNN